jgi:hypothetical protein
MARQQAGIRVADPTTITTPATLWVPGIAVRQGTAIPQMKNDGTADGHAAAGWADRQSMQRCTATGGFGFAGSGSIDGHVPTGV